MRLEVISGFLETITRTTERPEATARLARSAIRFVADLRGSEAPDAALLDRVCTDLPVVATRTSRPRIHGNSKHRYWQDNDVPSFYRRAASCQ